MSDRVNFGKLREVIQPPNLIEIQITSYLDYLQKGVPEKQRKPQGLEAVFKEVFPIESYDGRLVLEYVSYTLGEPKNSEIECIREGITYSVPLYVKLRLREEDFIKDEEIYMGEIPMVTERGSFIINGAERVVVSQLHRSPGIAFEVTPHANGKPLHSFRIIPDRGTWLEVQFDNNDLLYVYLDRRRRRRKFLITTLLRSIGYSSDIDILNLFYEIKDLKVSKALDLENVSTLVLVEDAIDAQKGVVLARAFEPLTKAIVRTFEKHDITTIRIIDTAADEGAIIRALKKDPTRNEEEALKEIYKRLRPGEPPTTANAKALLKRLFFDPKRYDLGRVGRYKINQKLGLKVEIEQRILESGDIVSATKYLVRLKKGEGVVDDIDHLGSRRVRTVGVPGSSGPHHVLMDCGVHSQGDAKTIGKAVEDVAAQTNGKIDIVVATHAHQDHISGFGAFSARFRQFQVKEVWLPWTEDPSDSGAAALKRKQAAAVAKLTLHFAAAGDPKFDAARAALVLLAGNQPALELLKGGFAGATVRYLEAGKQLQAPAGITGLAAQILGPPRDPAFLARMDPPAGQRYLALKNGRAREMSGLQPFPKKWRAGAGRRARLNPKDLNYLHEIASASNHGLAFALDQAINNTSVVALLTYRGKHLLFPGDAQYGNWQNWLEGDNSKALLADLDFYKVSHHGSLNATPKGALEGMAAGRLAAMVSTQNQPWPSIPYGNLMDALQRQTGNKVVRSDSLPIAGAPKGPALTKLPQGFTQGPFWYDYTIPLG